MTTRLVRIIPLVRMPRSLGFFDYALPDGMEAGVGALVTIPFRGRKLPGLVVATPSESEVPAGRIKHVLDLVDAPSLGLPVVEAILRLAEASLTSPATAAHALLPTMPKRKTSASAPVADPFHLPDGPEPEPPLWHDALLGGVSLFAYDGDQDRASFLAAAVRHAHASGAPLLFIAPRTGIARSFVEQFGAHGTLVTGEGAMGARWKAWRGCRSASVIAGTALALFTPHQKPFAIIVDEEDAAEHLHGDAAPRFDARDAAERIAKGWGCPIVFLSRTPSVSAWHRLGDTMRLIPREKALQPKTVICDFGDEFRSRRFSPVALPFLTAIDAALDAGKRTIVVVNRKGDAARLVCRDCRKVSSCPTCRTPLAVHGPRLVCPKCRHAEDVPALCPSCRGTRLVGSGLGIDAIAAFLARRREGIRVGTYTKASHDPRALEADIVVGTEFLMSDARERLVADERVGFVGTLSADTFLVRLADPMSLEREYARLRRLVLLAAAHDLPCHLQTSEPELPLYAMLAMAPEMWYRHELNDRKSAGIPPYSAAARLVASGAYHDKLKKEAETLAATLKGAQGFSIFEVRIVRSGARSKAWIGLTFAVGAENSVRKTLAQLLPESWGYDPAPHEPLS